MNFALHCGLIQKFLPILTTEEAPPPCGPTRSVENNRDQSLSDTSQSPSAIGKAGDTIVVNDHIDGEQHFHFILPICECESLSIVVKCQAVLLSVIKQLCEQIRKAAISYVLNECQALEMAYFLQPIYACLMN